LKEFKTAVHQLYTAVQWCSRLPIHAPEMKRRLLPATKYDMKMNRR